MKMNGELHPVAALLPEKTFHLDDYRDNFTFAFL
jgi:hypothetical protein